LAHSRDNSINRIIFSIINDSLDGFLKRYDKSREKLEEKVEKAVKDVIGRSGLATKDELEEIKAEIKKLKKSSAKQ
jgi:polyhydroxyalkanoate synthesis regulator phasin